MSLIPAVRTTIAAIQTISRQLARYWSLVESSKSSREDHTKRRKSYVRECDALTLTSTKLNSPTGFDVAPTSTVPEDLGLARSRLIKSTQKGPLAYFIVRCVHGPKLLSILARGLTCLPLEKHIHVLGVFEARKFRNMFQCEICLA